MSFKHWNGMNRKIILIIFQYKSQEGLKIWNLSRIITNP